MIGSSASLDLGKVNGPTILIVGLGNGSIDVIEVLFFYLLGKIESQDMSAVEETAAGTKAAELQGLSSTVSDKIPVDTWSLISVRPTSVSGSLTKRKRKKIPHYTPVMVATSEHCAYMTLNLSLFYIYLQKRQWSGNKKPLH